MRRTGKHPPLLSYDPCHPHLGTHVHPFQAHGKSTSPIAPVHPPTCSPGPCRNPGERNTLYPCAPHPSRILARRRSIGDNLLVRSLLCRPATLRHLLCATPILLAAALPAQQALPPSPNLAGIAHVALRVSDLSASLAFYEKLGFVKAFELSREGKVYEAFLKINDRQFIELYPVDSKNPQVGFLHLCFEGRDLNSVHDFYVAHGLTPTPVKTAGAGNLLFTMPGPLTPQGPQNIEYTQYQPGSLHTKDLGEHLGANRISTELTSVTLAAQDPAAARAFYLEQAGFKTVPSSLSLVALPGAQASTLEIVPAASIGFKARLSLRVLSPPTPESLHKRRLTFSQQARITSLADPDGNQVLLAPIEFH